MDCNCAEYNEETVNGILTSIVLCIVRSRDVPSSSRPSAGALHTDKPRGYLDVLQTLSQSVPLRLRGWLPHIELLDSNLRLERSYMIPIMLTTASIEIHTTIAASLPNYP